MSDSYVQLQPDSTGKKIQNFENVVGGNTVEAQAVVLVDQFGVPISSPGNVGTANLLITKGNASNSASTIAIARPTRRSLVIRNMDSSLTLYVGPATVTVGNGYPILPGESQPFTWIGLIQVISVSGSPAWVVGDEYD